MNLLLTSAGLFYPELQKTFLEMIGEPEKVNLVYITTAGNLEKDQSYQQRDLELLHSFGISQITLVDISHSKETWLDALQKANILYVCGGNTYYLMHHVQQSGFAEILRSVIERIVYVGVSAGSIIVTPSIAVAGVEPADPNSVNLTNLAGVGLVEFEVSPHTPDMVSVEAVAEYAQSTSRPVYAYADPVAVKVTDKKIEFVGEGYSHILNS